jgi:hypothetical protein
VTADPASRTFRVQLWVPVVSFGVFAQVTTALVQLATAAAFGQEPRWEPFVKWAAVNGVLALLAAVLLWATHRVVVGPAGLEFKPGPDGPLPWAAIRVVRRRQLPGLGYLRLGTDDGQACSIPLFLADPPAFVAAVEEFAGPDHPLTRALVEWVEGG